MSGCDTRKGGRISNCGHKSLHICIILEHFNSCLPFAVLSPPLVNNIFAHSGAERAKAKAWQTKHKALASQQSGPTNRSVFVQT